MKSAAVILSASDGGTAGAVIELRAVLPHVELLPEGERDGAARVAIGAEAWRAGAIDLLALDDELRAAEDRGPFALEICGARALLPSVAPEILTRYQRLVPRTNPTSDSPFFSRVLALHRSLHRLEHPAVRAEHERMIDTWQWALRLEPSASLAVQLAALLHGLDRLERLARGGDEDLEADPTPEDERARRGGALVRAFLRKLEAWPNLVAHVEAVVARRGRPGSEDDLALLDDADGLSFLSLSSPGFLAREGLEATARRVEAALACMRPAARELISGVRLLEPVAEMVERARQRGDLERPPASPSRCSAGLA